MNKEILKENVMPILVKRRLIASGAGALVVTVPKGWWTYHQLRAGDEVIVVADGELRIRPLRKGKDTK